LSGSRYLILLLWLGLIMQGFGFSQTHFNGHRFFNPFPGFEARSTGDILKWFFWDRLTGKRKVPDPQEAVLPLANAHPELLKENRTRFSVTWIGHSTLFIQLDGVNILTDPIFSTRCSPFSFIGPKRAVPPGIPLDSLPPIDLVVISHDHYDHLDKATIKRLGNRPLYVVPIAIGTTLRSWGITHFIELDWWGAFKFKGLTIVCTPAQHFSGRTPWGQNRTLWASWLIKGSSSFYFGGDTGYFPGFDEIRHREGKIDYAALPIGANAPRWFMKPVHMNPADAVKAFLELNAHVLLPIHWGTFQLGDEPLDAPPKMLVKEAEKKHIALERLWILKHGETRFSQSGGD